MFLEMSMRKLAAFFPPGPEHVDLLHEASAKPITNQQCRRDWPFEPDRYITNTTFCVAVTDPALVSDTQR